MDIRELKIGSLVLENVKGNWYEQVIEELTLIEINGQSPEDFKGIPLTEDWLIKLGFTQTDFSFDRFKLSIVLPNQHGYPKGRTYFNSWCILDAPKFVHQIQNIFFSLTESELTIK